MAILALRLFKSSDLKETSHQELVSRAQPITLARNQQFHFTVSRREDCLDFRCPLHMPQTSIIGSALPRLRIRGHLLGFVSAVMFPRHRGHYSTGSINCIMSPDGEYKYYYHMNNMDATVLNDMKPLLIVFGSCACKNEYADLLRTQSERLLSRVQPWDTPIYEFLNTIKARGIGKGRTLFRTELSLGIARGAFQSNETVWALDGVRVPLILRSIDGHYMLVEECYLHGALQRSVYCKRCGTETELQPIVHTEIIDIW